MGRAEEWKGKGGEAARLAFPHGMRMPQGESRFLPPKGLRPPLTAWDAGKGAGAGTRVTWW